MTPLVAGRVVAAMVNIWPAWTVGDETVEAWAAATPNVDPKVAHAAVMRLAGTDEFAPSIARFMNHVHLIEREEAGHGRQQVGSGPVDRSTRRVASERVRFLHAGWMAAAEERPDHDHTLGDVACPRCSTSTVWVADTNRELLAAMFDEVPR